MGVCLSKCVERCGDGLSYSSFVPVDPYKYHPTNVHERERGGNNDQTVGWAMDKE